MVKHAVLRAIRQPDVSVAEARMSCNKCGSIRIADVSGKVNDTFHVYLHASDTEQNDYVSESLGVGHGDYVDFTYCLNCGQIQGSFPRPPYFSEYVWEMEPEAYE
jgi:hypothetical protein